jgi:hypothetical protein
VSTLVLYERYGKLYAFLENCGSIRAEEFCEHLLDWFLAALPTDEKVLRAQVEQLRAELKQRWSAQMVECVSPVEDGPSP